MLWNFRGFLAHTKPERWRWEKVSWLEGAPFLSSSFCFSAIAHHPTFSNVPCVNMWGELPQSTLPRMYPSCTCGAGNYLSVRVLPIEAFKIRMEFQSFKLGGGEGVEWFGCHTVCKVCGPYVVTFLSQLDTYFYLSSYFIVRLGNKYKHHTRAPPLMELQMGLYIGLCLLCSRQDHMFRPSPKLSCIVYFPVQTSTWTKVVKGWFIGCSNLGFAYFVNTPHHQPR